MIGDVEARLRSLEYRNGEIEDAANRDRKLTDQLRQDIMMLLSGAAGLGAGGSPRFVRCAGAPCASTIRYGHDYQLDFYSSYPATEANHLYGPFPMPFRVTSPAEIGVNPNAGFDALFPSNPDYGCWDSGCVTIGTSGSSVRVLMGCFRIGDSGVGPRQSGGGTFYAVNFLAPPPADIFCGGDEGLAAGQATSFYDFPSHTPGPVSCSPLGIPTGTPSLIGGIFGLVTDSNP